MRRLDLESVWRSTLGRYPYLAALPPFKTKWLYQMYEESLPRAGEIRTVLELGIYQGGSLILWHEALKCRVIGVDLSPAPATARLLERYMREAGAVDAIHAHWRTDQTDERALQAIAEREVVGALDVVIDDASHLYAPTRRSFEILFPLLRPGGLYFVEDWGAGRRPDFRSPDGPIERVLVDLTNGIADGSWPIELLEVRAACAMVVKSRITQGPTLLEVHPNRVRVAEVFNPQDDGSSALALVCNHATAEARIIVGDRELGTTYGSRQLLTAIVPADLVSRPGRHEVFIRQGKIESNRLQFIVEP